MKSLTFLFLSSLSLLSVSAVCDTFKLMTAVKYSSLAGIWYPAYAGSSSFSISSGLPPDCT